jgi:hypothetical protein
MLGCPAPLEEGARPDDALAALPCERVGRLGSVRVRRAEQRSDIFALGATMHHLFTKQDPRLRAPFTFHQHPILQYNPAVSPELDAVVMTCLQQAIGKRFQSISELRPALEAAISTGQLPQQ